jgi:uncharacterized membrane protein
MAVFRSGRCTWCVVAPLLLAWGAIATPYLSTHGLLLFGFALERGFALVCHQRPERCFWLFGAPVAVCTRCLGIYIGAAFGLLMRTPRFVAMRLLIAAAALNALDVATELAGLHGNWLTVRFVLGLILGAAGALLISSSIPEQNVSPAEGGSPPKLLAGRWPEGQP